jgi:hypothetical protein
MANQDYLSINGSQVSLSAWDAAIDRCTPFIRGGIPELGFSRILGPLTTLPDPWSGQACAWSNGASYPGTTYFTGDVVGYSDRYDRDLGWIREYRALGLRDRADWIPVTDSNTLSDSASYNLPPTDPTAILARTGRTMGQCVLDVLSMSTTAAALSAVGVGKYTSTGTGGAGVAVLGGTRGWTVSSITVAAPGSGYTVAPTVVISGPCTTQAVYTATVSGGAITGFVQVNAGAGYLTPPGVIISTLPAATITDLAALTVIPPYPVRFAGERIIQNIESVIQTAHPNHWVYVTGDNAGSDVIGTIRVLDQRLFSNNTVTLGGSDHRWLMPSLHRDTSDCYSQLVVRGGLQTGSTTLALKQWPGSSYTYYWPPSGGTVACGGLVEDFTFGSYTTNAAAKAAWAPTAYSQLSLQTGQDQGSCTCPSTTTVVITSQNTALTLAANQLDQTNTGQHAVITVISDVITGVQQLFSARVVANTAMTAGGTSTLTLDQALPALTYNSYRMYALSAAGNVVWRRYLVTNPAIAASMQQSFPYPFAFKNSNGTAAALTMAPMCNVLWSASGSPPYNQSTIGCVIDPVAGTITTVSPTSLVYGGGVVTPPSDVQVFVPIATGALETIYPTSGYGGTLYSIEGVQRTKTVTVRDWTDYSLTTQMQQYASELFGSICDVVVEGTIGYLGLATAYMTPGQAVSIAGNGYTTGYESISNYGGNNGIAVASLEVAFNPGAGGTSYVSTLHLSNRKQRYTSEIFIRPAVRGQQLGGSLGAGYGAAWARGMSEFNAVAQSGDIAGNTLASLSEAGGRASGAMGVGEGEAAIPQFGPAGRTVAEARAAESRLVGPATERTPEQRAIDKDQAENARLTRRREQAAAKSPFEEINKTAPEHADIKQAERRQRARNDGQYEPGGGGAE